MKTMIIKMDSNTEIKFNSHWDLWYHHTLDDWTIGGYRKIFTIKTVADFWNVFNNIDCLGGINNVHYFLMRKGITPTYEDPKNEFGGTWSMLTSSDKDKAYETWEFLATRLVGETLVDDPLSITGLSINVKSDMSVIKIWNNNTSQNSVTKLPKIPNLQSDIIYKKHQVKRR